LRLSKDGATTTTVLHWLISIFDHLQQSRQVCYEFSIIVFLCQFIQDMMGIIAIFGTLRLLYCITHFSYQHWKSTIQDCVFDWAKDHITAVSKYLEEETEKLAPSMEQSYGKSAFQSTKLTSIPEKGRNPQEILEELKDCASKENQTWKSGKLSGTVYTADDDNHIHFLNETYGLYSLANTLHAGVWPRLNQCEAELVAMTSQLFHGNGIGCTTSGGTESIMLAIKAHWVYYGKRRGIAHPELICSSTAHAAVDKACELLGIRKVVIDANDDTNTYSLSPHKVRRKITANTIMIYASAPNYPQGTIDPVQDLGSIAIKYQIGLHVDACLGGFVLAFAEHDEFSVHDFRVPGVTSLSVDTHKFGYAPKGTSVLLYRNKHLRHAQYFSYARWTGGMYCTPTFAGSRPSALIGCAWAALVSIGKDGYRERAKQILQASQKISKGIQEMIPELSVLGQQRPSIVVCFGSKPNASCNGVDIYRVADAMKERGWSLNSLQHPPSVHVCVTLPLAPHAELFLSDLKSSVAQVLKEDPSCSKKGTAGMYGMAGSIPEGPVNEFLRAFVDAGLDA
jgi:glutamate/tyrosine decarboxylase-like PLP-dependent enzyme